MVVKKINKKISISKSRTALKSDLKSNNDNNNNINNNALSTETAIFAAGCFWGVEELYRKLPGVISTQVGYTGGSTKDPNYTFVCTGFTGHAEAVKIVYNPKKIKYEKLLEIFFDNHNPTTPNRQGWDIGSQYRSAIFYATSKQKEIAEKSVAILAKSGRFKSPIVTKIEKASTFYPAEEYHQKYLMKKGLKSCHI